MDASLGLDPSGLWHELTGKLPVSHCSSASVPRLQYGDPSVAPSLQGPEQFGESGLGQWQGVSLSPSPASPALLAPPRKDDGRR